jgi:hypothetical protein
MTFFLPLLPASYLTEKMWREECRVRLNRGHQ